MNINEKERLLCYSAAILGSRLSNPNHNYSVDGLINSSIRAANKLIHTIMDDAALDEVLKHHE